MEDLKLIVFDNIKEVGEEVDKYLMKMNKTDKSYIMDVKRSRFNNGEGKVVLVKRWHILMYFLERYQAVVDMLLWQD